MSRCFHDGAVINHAGLPDRRKALELTDEILPWLGRRSNFMLRSMSGKSWS